MNRRKLRLLTPGSYEYVIEHAKWRASRGRKPSVGFGDERNPIKALSLAKRYVVDLIRRYENDIQFDVHSVEQKVNRSDARVELQSRGRTVLANIGNHIATRFPKGGFHQESSKVEYFLAWAYLLFGIVRDHGLREHCPYASKTPFGEQDMQVWAKFCFEQAA